MNVQSNSPFERCAMMDVMKEIVVHDTMQQGYRYTLVESEGKNCAPDFKPNLTPAQIEYRKK